ncbi:CHASE2 domain-containing protein [Micavibrio aeruginosavorus]|uniref:Adenylate cyclase n=1 Tax=Micavibrio aeruginosavorus EPB TaxID=349215 RepID=M4VHB5_9BACT|nr:adenylate/guanylate cyclase domain-containing protein [Micavibrio aeruginosavorus]AGH98588.1 Adenylate cyclase [Micavibrio aeruginosavorus EPB]
MMRLAINRWFHLCLLLVLVAVAVGLSFSNARWRQEIRHFTFDYYNILKPRDPGNNVVIVDIDEASMARPELGQWPWPRDVLAQLVEKLNEQGALVIAFDTVFPEHDRVSPQRLLSYIPTEDGAGDLRAAIEKLPDNDTVFGDAIAKAGNVITGFSFVTEETGNRPMQKAFFSQKNAERYVRIMNNATVNLPVISKGAYGEGSFFVTADTDGVIRRVPMVVAMQDQGKDGGDISFFYPSLSLEVVRYLLGEKALSIELADERFAELDSSRFGVEGLRFLKNKVLIPTDAQGNFLAYFAKSRDDWYVSAASVLDGTVDPSLIRSKIVLIGTSAIGLKDIRATPLDVFRPGVEVHLNIIDQILQEKFLHRSIEVEGLEAVAILVAGLLIVGLAPFIGAFGQAAMVTLLVGGGVYGGWYAFLNHGQLIDVFYPSLALGVIFMASALLAYIRMEADRRQIRQAFGLYISPDYMKELTNDPDKLRLGGEVRELSIMFTDIRGFTSISERLSPEELIQLMNDFLTPMSSLVMENRGTIDKYMGDAMMAFWNAPLDDPDHARRACLTALQMNDALAPINAALAERAAQNGQKPLVLSAGIGVNTGMTSVGNMGSKQRFAYSALGDSVNLASRLEGQTKAYGVQILVSERTKNAAGPLAFVELDLLRVKGKTEPVRIFTLVGDESYAMTPDFMAWMVAHQSMLDLYRAADFDGAEQALVQARSASNAQMNGYYDVFLSRIRTLKNNRPGDGWDGVFEATSK